MIEQKDLTAGKLGAIVDELIENPARFAEIGRNARNMAVTDAKERILEQVLSLL